MTEQQTTDLWRRVAQNIIYATPFKVGLTDTIIELVKTIIDKEQAKFLTVFTKTTLNLEELKERTQLEEDYIKEILNALLKTGLLMALPSKHTGEMIYRLLPLFPGIFELSFMRGETGEKEKRLSRLFDKVFEEMTPLAQEKYERTVKSYKRLPAFDRVIPVEEEVEIPLENVFPVEDVRRLVEKHDLIALSRCYCRHEQDLLGNPCKLDAPRDTCMFFGRIAEFFITHEFAHEISKEKALSILEVAEEKGLVHKTFHDRLNPNMEEIAICSCCPCCCQIFGLWKTGAIPLHSLTSYLSHIDEDLCIGCGTCVEKCAPQAIELMDNCAVVNKDRCIGCGVCAHHCSEEAITLERTGPRKVFIPPPKLSMNEL